ncbi:regulator of G-protein signaling loco isoform X7 [Macrobrachium rosenbergii]|uniref:regulator of G-protein signaling loco isoform X7 n=1 Tax=Macrobrachium rosenbergii TaxID=79674 RepID=UPI0034D749A7
MFRSGKKKKDAQTAAATAVPPQAVGAPLQPPSDARNALVATPIRIAMMSHNSSSNSGSNKNGYINIFKTLNNNNNKDEGDGHGNAVPKSHRPSWGSKKDPALSATSGHRGSLKLSSPRQQEGKVVLRNASPQQQEGKVVLRSPSRRGGATSPPSNSPQRSTLKRNSDSIRRRSGSQHHRASSDYSKKRNSDPVALTTFASGVASLRAMFNHDDGPDSSPGKEEGLKTAPTSPATPPDSKDLAKTPSKNNKVEGSSEKKWARSNSLRRPFHRARDNNNSHGHHHHQDPAAHSDTEIGKISAPHSLLDGERGSGGGSVTSERAIDVGRVAAWAASFEKLLEDPAGLHTFAEFLKKEYSHENIYFWTACERYKRLSSPDELQAMAKVIFERHLCIGASEPVNVDSQARQDAQDSLHNPNEFLFSQAQKQIFNLMKFDSYSRFLKSNLYQDCLASDMRGQTLPYPGDETMDPDLKIIQDDCHVALKKSKSDADERRRKSLLPWHRKDRSKSKDRGEAEYRRQKKMGHRNQSDSSSVRSDMSGSRTSLNSSSDLALGRRAVSKESLTSGELGSLSGSEGYHRCRVILPDLSNSVVAVRHGETIQELLTRLLERRGISYSTFEVYQNKTDKLIDKNDDSVILGGMEVRIERRVLFRLDLPNRKTVCIKARPNKLTSEVLKPILHKYSYKLDLMSIHKVGEEKSINLKAPITEIDGDRLVVQTKEEVKEWGIEPARQKKKRGNGNTLDEITNRVFEDLLKGKSEQNFDELGILDFDARSSRTEHSSDQSSSGVTGGFGLRNSAPTEKDLNKSRKPPNRASVHDSLGVRGMPPPDHALISKRRGMGSNTPNPNDELYEGLKRAQRSRLDDQRGTEINFELPDFLKCDDDQPEDKENQRAHLTDQLLAQLECSFSDGGVIPTHREADDYFSIAHPEVWGGIPTSGTSGPHSANATLMAPDLDLDDFDDTLVAGEDSLGKVVPMPDAPSCPALHMDPPNFSPPPPLPPKPKLGGTRGPPPRPPSRQLHPFNPPTFSSTSDDDGLHHSSDPPIHLGRQSISFV